MDATLQGMIAAGQAKIAIEKETERLAEEKAEAKQRVERERVLGELLTAAQSLLPVALHSYLSVPDFSAHCASNTVCLQVPDLGKIDFTMSYSPTTGWRRNGDFCAFGYTTWTNDDNEQQVIARRNYGRRSADLEIVLAEAVEQGARRRDLQTACEQRNAKVQEAYLQHLAEREAPAAVEAAFAPEPTADEIFLDALHEYVRRVLDEEHSCCG